MNEICLDYIVLARSIIEDFGRAALLCKFLQFFKVVNPRLNISEGFGELDGALMYFLETIDDEQFIVDEDPNNTMRYLVLSARLDKLPFQFWKQYFMTSTLIHSRNFHNDPQNSAFYAELEGLASIDAGLCASELKGISQLELVEVTASVQHFCHECGIADVSVYDNIQHRLLLSSSDEEELADWLTDRVRQATRENVELEEESNLRGDQLLESLKSRFWVVQEALELAEKVKFALTHNGTR